MAKRQYFAESDSCNFAHSQGQTVTTSDFHQFEVTPDISLGTTEMSEGQRKASCWQSLFLLDLHGINKPKARKMLILGSTALTLSPSPGNIATLLALALHTSSLMQT